MKHSLHLFILFVFLASAISCTDNQLEKGLDQLAGVEIHDTHTLQGKTEIDGVTISYRTQLNDNNAYQVKVAINGQVLAAEVSYDQESIQFDGHGVSFTESQKLALLSAANQLYLFVDQQPEEVTYAEYSLIRLMEYWSRSPYGYVYGAHTIESNLAPTGVNHQRLGNEGITCIRKNTYVTAEYDRGNSGTRYNERVKVGSKARSGYDCMGRCGADCGWGAPSAWTKDCMDHDQCSNRFNASGGSGDSNCGDEFNEAADDWLFGVIRGCRG